MGRTGSLVEKFAGPVCPNPGNSKPSISIMLELSQNEKNVSKLDQRKQFASRLGRFSFTVKGTLEASPRGQLDVKDSSPSDTFHQ